MSKIPIVSGRYRGPLKSRWMKRGLLMDVSSETLYLTDDLARKVLVQWDDLDLHEQIVKSTGKGLSLIHISEPTRPY